MEAPSGNRRGFLLWSLLVQRSSREPPMRCYIVGLSCLERTGAARKKETNGSLFFGLRVHGFLSPSGSSPGPALRLPNVLPIPRGLTTKAATTPRGRRVRPDLRAQGARRRAGVGRQVYPLSEKALPPRRRLAHKRGDAGAYRSQEPWRH